jgi:hypothetical protein
VTARATQSADTGETDDLRRGLASGAVSRADAVRAFGVTFGGALALDMLFAVAILTSARAVRRRRRPSALAVGGTAAAVVYATAVRRWMDQWGVECGESPAHAVGNRCGTGRRMAVAGNRAHGAATR